MGAATTILVSPVGLLALMSKKRNHVVTIGWTVDGNNEAAVFELGKSVTRPAIAALEARAGKGIDYESEDAVRRLPDGRRLRLGRIPPVSV
jgi:hypothetical protein